MITALRELASSRELLFTLVERQLRLRSKRTLFGLLWPLVAPLFLLLLYLFVFQSVFRVPVPRYHVYLFAGLLPWAFLTQSLGLSITSLSNEPELVRRARFPRELLPISSVLSMSFHFLALLAVFVTYLAIRGWLEPVLLPVIVLPVVATLLLVMSGAVILALIDVYNRDLRSILGNLLTIWFFLVPIVYRPDMVPDQLQFLRSVDPMNIIVGQFRYVLYGGFVARPAHVVYMLVVCAALFLVSLAIFRRFSPDLPRDI
jgi:lipopolysaccharide transport system permease protein